MAGRPGLLECLRTKAVLRLRMFWSKKYDFCSLQGAVVNSSRSSALQMLQCTRLKILMFVKSEFLAVLEVRSEQA